ncbi:hypothetical protein N7507_006672 [Penicillium longicatenatum]|nr:hypothetical protein N7507_006672 [Penicillium longicatenatum]
MSTSTVSKDEQASRDPEIETQLEASVSTHGETDEERSAGSPAPESDDESDEEVLRSIGSVEGEELLAFFDKVRNAYQIDTSSLPLPQLVAVGGTSCGKSSLLQALTKLPFPVDNGICTLFATETTIHRCDPFKHPHYTITIETKGGGNTFLPREYSNESWANVSQHLKEDLKDVFAQQHAQSKTPRVHGGKAGLDRLHEQVMRVNVYKHNQAHFSVVDIPGLISGGSRADQRLSESLARQYMANPRAIVLAVMPAVDDIHNQAVLRLAREEGAMNRTIGVITKCDMLQKNDEPKTIELLKNQNSETTEEVEKNLSHQKRDKKEHQLFSQEPWSSLKSNFVGLANLNRCVSDTLYKHVKKSFPGVQKDINRKLRAARHDLDLLGPSRDNEKMQMLYLDDVQRQYKDLAQKWLAGIYKEGCAPDDPSKLTIHLIDLEEQFQIHIERHGTNFRYLSKDEILDRLRDLDYGTVPEMWETKMLEVDDVLSWILRFWNENRSDGLWYKDPRDLEERLLELQIRSWGQFARDYFDDASQKIRAFSDTLLNDVCSDSVIRGRIQQSLETLKVEAVSRAEQELDILLKELDRMTTCHRQYKEQLQKSHQEVNDILAGCGDNKLRRISSAHVNLREFQQMAQWRFIDNVIIQVVRRHLLGASGLVFCFSTDWIRSLPEDQLDDLVGEDDRRKQTRADLETQIRDLGEIQRKAEALQTRR